MFLNKTAYRYEPSSDFTKEFHVILIPLLQRLNFYNPYLPTYLPTCIRYLETAEKDNFTWNSNRLTTEARATLASSRANRIPKQFRGPCPNPKKTYLQLKCYIHHFSLYEPVYTIPGMRGSKKISCDGLIVLGFMGLSIISLGLANFRMV